MQTLRKVIFLCKLAEVQKKHPSHRELWRERSWTVYEPFQSISSVFKTALRPVMFSKWNAKDYKPASWSTNLLIKFLLISLGSCLITTVPWAVRRWWKWIYAVLISSAGKRFTLSSFILSTFSAKCILIYFLHKDVRLAIVRNECTPLWLECEQSGENTSGAGNV